MSIVFPPHYTAQDIQAVKDISVWCAATARSTTALAQMIADRELLMAKVSRFGNTYVVIYPVCRVPVERPGRRATTKPRGPNIVITPSTRAGSGRGSRP